MNLELLNQYDLNFVNYEILNINRKGASSDTNKLLALMITNITTPWEIDEFFLEEIKPVLSGDINFFDFNLNFNYARVYLHETHLFEDDNRNMQAPDFSLPTSDFIAILKEWKEFHLQKPLNQTLVGNNV